MIELIIIVTVVVAIGVGIYLGSLGNTDSETPGSNQRSDECRQACAQWQARKAELCDAERAEADAKERVDLIADLLKAVAAGTISVVVALIGAAALVAMLSELGVPAVVAVALLVGGAAIAALGGVVIVALTAALITATLLWTEKQQATSAAESAETEARTILNNACPQDEVSVCVANSPC